ncbi:50S ribosomal protein L6 [Candidatus Dojkabacteria bacterium]|jgi:large subunit ribosomal protein L6|nr:50S ribosomal protein L6 [Candidatus Dojkabacteria bacterium]
MSRVGLDPIKIEEGVTVKIENKDVTVTGPKGELKLSLPWEISVENTDGILNVKRGNDEIKNKALHGTFRMIIANAIHGVKNGFEKKLELVGVGYRAKMEGTMLVLNLGLNHPIKFTPPVGIVISVPEETKITISGIDKQAVGEYAALVREVRKPEPYKGKGIRYEGEYVRRKNPKAAIGKK